MRRRGSTDAVTRRRPFHGVSRRLVVAIIAPHGTVAGAHWVPHSCSRFAGAFLFFLSFSFVLKYRGIYIPATCVGTYVRGADN